MADGDLEQASPWRGIFVSVRHAVGNRRDDQGVVGSINWLRKQMEAHGANPNVVRNIIYRDKGKLADKRVLFEVLNELWVGTGKPPLRAPELEVLLSPGGGAEQEVLQLLGREKRRAYRSFVGGVRGGGQPKLLVTGRPGSGKTLLADYIQQALEMAPRAADTIVRLEFPSPDLASALSRLAAALGVESKLLESKLLRIGTSSAFAVQADAQADVARVVIDTVRQRTTPLVLLVHVSQSLAGQDSLGLAALRLNTSEVPRVTASEWLWLSLFEPLSRLGGVALLVSMTDVPARALQHLGGFDGPVKLTPPTTSEARRFVKARLPHLPPSQQEDIVRRAGRSFEELRTLTLLAEVREPIVDGQLEAAEESIQQLSRLVECSGEPRLRSFLAALAVLSIPEFPTFHQDALHDLRNGSSRSELSSFELAFLDPVPGTADAFRCFSRQLARSLRQRLQATDPGGYRRLNQAAAESYHGPAREEPTGEAAARFLHHVFEARDWDTLTDWLRRFSIQQSLVRRIWQAAENELKGAPGFAAIAQQVAAHYVKLGSYEHADARHAFMALAESDDAEVRAWTNLKRAEGEVLKGHFDRAEELLTQGPPTSQPLLRAEVALAKASIARWRSELDEAARLVDVVARPASAGLDDADGAVRLAHAKVAVWAGLIKKDRGDLDGALHEFESVSTDDELIRARLAFQRGDVRMRLGHFDHAMLELNQAVRLSQRSEALIQEQARYLSRRGALTRSMGDLGGAHEDFAAARGLLEAAEADGLERGFWLAKVDDESAWSLLAGGAFEEATFSLTRALLRFEAYARAFEVDAEYRVLRTTLRLAVAYACRALALPYRRPFPLLRLPLDEVADLLHARERITDVQHELEAKPNRDHHSGLLRATHLHAGLFAATAAEAEGHGEAALALSLFPFQRAEAQSVIASARLRLGDAATAEAALREADSDLAECLRTAGSGERGDGGLRAQLSAIAVSARLLEGDGRSAANKLVAALHDPALTAYHEGLLRAFGESAERAPVAAPTWLHHPPLGALLGPIGDPHDVGPARLPDVLVARWRERSREPALT